MLGDADSGDPMLGPRYGGNRCVLMVSMARSAFISGSQGGQSREIGYAASKKGIGSRRRSRGSGSR